MPMYQLDLRLGDIEGDRLGEGKIKHIRYDVLKVISIINDGRRTGSD